jgi:ribosomal protein S18 acetylase RimI-like enzyme
VTFSVRRLGAADAAAYRDIRLEALADAPTAFGSDVPRERAFADAVWLERLAANPTYGVFEADNLVGIATLAREPGEKSQHRANIYGVYVKPKARGRGASRQLLEAVIAAAKEIVVQVHLCVTTSNAPAVRLYERLGFTIYGTEPRALFVDGRYHDEHLMVLRLDEGQRKVTDNE